MSPPLAEGDEVLAVVRDVTEQKRRLEQHLESDASGSEASVC